MDTNPLRRYSEMDEELNRICDAFWYSNSSGDREASQKEADSVKDEIEAFRKWERDRSGALPISCNDIKIGKMSLNVLSKKVLNSKKLSEVRNVEIFGSENSEFLLLLQLGWESDYLYYIAEKLMKKSIWMIHQKLLY